MRGKSKSEDACREAEDKTFLKMPARRALRSFGRAPPRSTAARAARSTTAGRRGVPGPGCSGSAQRDSQRPASIATDARRRAAGSARIGGPVPACAVRAARREPDRPRHRRYVDAADRHAPLHNSRVSIENELRSYPRVPISSALRRPPSGDRRKACSARTGRSGAPSVCTCVGFACGFRLIAAGLPAAVGRCPVAPLTGAHGCPGG
jgi:hypothetical protein